jgi:hypothetical protein
MAHFRCGCQGSRNPVTRLGTRASGVSAFVNTWATQGTITAERRKDCNVLIFYTSEYGADARHNRVLARVIEYDDGRRELEYPDLDKNVVALWGGAPNNRDL